MAENQARAGRSRNEARGVDSHRRNGSEGGAGHRKFDETRSVGWRSIDRVVQFHSDPSFKCPDWQPRD